MGSQVRMSKAGSGLLLALLVLATLTCSDPEAADPVTESPEAAMRRRALLGALADNVYVPTYRSFSEKASTLATATAALADNPDGLAEAQNAWREAAAVWQRAEVMQIGPAGASEFDVAGAGDRRAEIYSWPQVNRCRVDQELVEGVFADAGAFAGEPINVRGLDAIEYLLFRADSENDCAANSAINRDGTWAQLGDEELARRRRAYAATASALLSGEAAGLLQAWESGFRDELAGAGDTSSTYPTTQAALNEVTNALFYLDTETKDMKLAQPLGLSDCDTATCPDQLESAWARASAPHIVANVRGVLAVWSGGDGDGFDDLLTEIGAGDLAGEMRTKLDAAVEACEQAGVLEADLAAEPPQTERGRACYDAIKGFTDLFKTQFLSVLDLEPPDRADGDND